MDNLRQEIEKRRTFAIISHPDEETKVTFYEISDEQIDHYIKTGEPMDKAGSYGIQGKAAVFIKGIEGDYYNVVGFPIARFLQEITK